MSRDSAIRYPALILIAPLLEMRRPRAGLPVRDGCRLLPGMAKREAEPAVPDGLPGEGCGNGPTTSSFIE
jgi:hypothetical protein